MRKVGFIVGPALGHVGRSFKAALQLRSICDAQIIFISPDHGRYVERLVGKDFETIAVPTSSFEKSDSFQEFASGLEQVFTANRFDIIVHDLCPLRWLSTTRFPDCPRVNVTNVFLTKIANARTSQAMRFDRIGDRINSIRTEKGLPPLHTVFDLYEADLVLLADPSRLTSRYGRLPSHYFPCGPSSWGADGNLPDALSTVKNALLLSMGSLGKRELDPELLTKIMRQAGCQSSIYVGNKVESVRKLGIVDHIYDWLPLEKVLDRVKVVMSHGGSGSTYQALSFGVPVIVFSMETNLEIFGNILEDLGVGICISDEASFAKIDAFDFNQLSANAVIFADEMKGQDGPDRIAREIANLL